MNGIRDDLHSRGRGRSIGVTSCFVLFGALLWTQGGEAAIRLMQTRLVHQGGEAALMVRNDGTGPSLMQAWVDLGDERLGPGEVATPFLVLPPVMRLGPGRGQTLRVIGGEQNRLPRDRESLFWLNVLGLPPKAHATEGSVQLAYRTRIKLFYRPPGLSGSVAGMVRQLKWQILSEGGLGVTNPGPFHISLSEVLLTMGDWQLAWREGGVLPPYGTLHLPMGVVPAGASGRLRWIDDEGSYREEPFMPLRSQGGHHE